MQKIQKTMKKHLLILTTFFTLTVAHGQTNVSGGTVSGTWTLAGSPYLIQGSIMVSNDSTLTIQPGVTVNFQGTYKLLVLGRLLAIGTTADTIIFTATNTTAGWRGIRFDNTSATNDTSKIFFCKLQYGMASGASPDNNGGGLYFNNISKAIIANSMITNCVGNDYGGGIYCSNSSPIIKYNTISNNKTLGISTTDHGGGIFITGSITPNVNNNIIANNSASNGGGFYIELGNPNIFNNTITNNSGSFAAGGIMCSSGNPLIFGNTISYNTCPNPNNQPDDGGGGIFCYTGSPVIKNNIISNNNSKNGGGIYNAYGSPVISFNTITDNQSNSGTGGAGILSASNATISYNTISNNASNSANGGGMYCKNNQTIVGNTITNNSASNGGGISFDGGIFSLTNNTIANNSAVKGGALYCENTSTPTFRNCIIYGNTASTSGAQVYLYDEPSDPNFYYCDVQGGTAAFDANGNFYTGTYQNNINANPLFVSPSGGSGTGFNGVTADWSLQSGSTCIDSGDPNGIYPTTDKAGNPRVSGCKIDMGAYEYQTSNSLSLTTSTTNPSTCLDSNGTATANVSGGTLPYTYLWSNGGTTSTITGIPNGSTYTVTITDAIGCFRFTSVFVSCTNGIQQLSSQNEFHIYPNPFSSSTTLQTDKFFKDATLTVYNLQGQTVKQIENLSGQTIIFYRDNLQSGLYFIRITQDNKVFSVDKLVITDN